MSETLSFETRVDLSGLNNGMNQAASTVQAGATKISSAMTAATQATQRLAEAQIAFGAAAAQGSTQAAAVIAQYQSELNNAKAAVDSLAASEEEEETVVRAGTSARMAANAELRVFEGNMNGSVRAAGALLAIIPGLGAAMQAAFPLFGAVALIEILAQVAEKVVTIEREYTRLTSIEKAFHDQLLADGEDEIRASNQLLESRRAIAVTTAEMNGGKAGRADRGAAAGSQFDITQDTDKLREFQDNAKAATDRMHELQEAMKPHYTHTTDGGQVQDNAHAAQVAGVLYEEAANKAQKFNDEATAAATKLQEDQDKNALRSKEASDKGGDSANSAKLKALEAALVQQELINGKSVDAEEAYWAQFVNTFAQGTTEYNTVAEKLLAAKTKVQEEFGRMVMSLVEDDQRTIDSNAKMGEELMATYDKITKQEEAATRATAEFNAEHAKYTIDQAQAAQNLELATASAEKQAGGITQLGLAQLTAAAHAEFYAEKLAALQKQLDAINAEVPTSQAGVSDQEKRASAVTNQITQTQGQQQVSGFNDQQAQASALSAPYLTAFNDINQGFVNVQNKMILGTQSISRDFANMGAQLVVSVADAFEKMLVKSLQFEIQSLAAHQLGNAQKVASTATAATATDAISATSALTQVAHEAAVAAAGVWASLSGIPIIGPVLGAAAAGATYAGVLALAAFETGGIIPNTGIAMVHQGEAVLPKQLTSLLLNTASNSTSNSNSVTQNNSFNGMSDKAFRSMATRNAEHMVSTVQRGLRRQGRV